MSHFRLLRNNLMLALARSGRYTLQEIGDRFGISRQRVWQIVKAMDPGLELSGTERYWERVRKPRS